MFRQYEREDIKRWQNEVITVEHRMYLLYANNEKVLDELIKANVRSLNILDTIHPAVLARNHQRLLDMFLQGSITSEEGVFIGRFFEYKELKPLLVKTFTTDAIARMCNGGNNPYPDATLYDDVAEKDAEIKELEEKIAQLEKGE
jgi:hypothetical protein